MRTTTAELKALYRPDTLPGGAVDARLVGVLRCILAVSGQTIAWLDPSDPLHLAGLTLIALSAYSAYSIALSYAVFLDRPFVRQRLQPWIDVAFATVLIAMTHAVSSVFFHFFFFAILVASFTQGHREGFAITAVSTVLFIGSEYFFPSTDEFELDRLLIRPVYLLLLGYMIAHWGGQEIRSRRRLWLLKEIGASANPRFGTEQTIGMHLRRLVAYFGAEGALLICPQGAGSDCRLYRVGTRAGETFALDVMPDGAAGALLQFASHTAVAFNRQESALAFLERSPWTLTRGAVDASIETRCDRVANLLETPRFITAPYRQHKRESGRVYLLGGRRSFSQEDAGFLMQAMDQIAATIDNLGLLEELMQNAATLERSRISRDIHDTTIQPYIGLKIGLEALHRGLEPGTPVEESVRDLIAMSETSIEDLRTYVASLRGAGRGWPADTLLASLGEQVQRYRTYCDIDITLRCDESLQLTDRLAGEAYQIICEALSNIYRHTEARRAFVEIASDGQSLELRIGNEGHAVAASLFTPHSIKERSMALGGTAGVMHSVGYDVIEVRIPL
jgi:signal transduction histidine kinase